MSKFICEFGEGTEVGKVVVRRQVFESQDGHVPVL